MIALYALAVSVCLCLMGNVTPYLRKCMKTWRCVSWKQHTNGHKALIAIVRKSKKKVQQMLRLSSAVD